MSTKQKFDRGSIEDKQLLDLRLTSSSQNVWQRTIYDKKKSSPHDDDKAFTHDRHQRLLFLSSNLEQASTDELATDANV